MKIRITSKTKYFGLELIYLGRDLFCQLYTAWYLLLITFIHKGYVLLSMTYFWKRHLQCEEDVMRSSTTEIKFSHANNNFHHDVIDAKSLLISLYPHHWIIYCEWRHRSHYQSRSAFPWHYPQWRRILNDAASSMTSPSLNEYDTMSVIAVTFTRVIHMYANIQNDTVTPWSSFYRHSNRFMHLTAMTSLATSLPSSTTPPLPSSSSSSPSCRRQRHHSSGRIHGRIWNWTKETFFSTKTFWYLFRWKKLQFSARIREISFE